MIQKLHENWANSEGQTKTNKKQVNKKKILKQTVKANDKDISTKKQNIVKEEKRKGDEMNGRQGKKNTIGYK